MKKVLAGLAAAAAILALTATAAQADPREHILSDREHILSVDAAREHIA